MASLTPHIKSEKTLADACALLLETGASHLIVDGATSSTVSLDQIRDLLAQHSHPLSHRLFRLPLYNTSSSSGHAVALDQCITTDSLLDLLQALVSSTTDWIYIKDLQGRYLFANTAFAKAIGHSQAEIIGATDLAISTAAIAQKAMQNDREIISSLATQTTEEVIATREGISTYLTTKGPLSSEGRLIGVFGICRDIGALKDVQASRDLHESELETIFQSLPDLFFRLSADGTILDYRAQTDSDLFRPASDFLGKRMQDVLPPNLSKIFREKIEEQKIDGQLLCFEYDLELPTGINRFEARLRDLPETNEQIALIRNITQQYTEHKALKKLEQQLAMALEATQEGVWDWDLATGTWTANARFFSMLGYSADTSAQLVESWYDKVHPDDIARRNSAFQTALRGESDKVDVEFRALNSSGHYQWIRARGKIVEVDLNNKPRRLVGTHEDVSVRRKLEERLKLAATVFENTAEGVIIADPKGFIIEVNQGFVDVTGFSREEAIGKHTRMLNSGRQAPAFYRSMWRELLETGGWKGELWNKRKDGAIIPEWLNINAVKDDNNNVSHFVAVFSDISVLKRSEEKLDYIAHHDTLTSLPNRLMLQARLGRALVHAHRNKQAIAILFLDIDRFKTINDSMGHHVGDNLLKQVANRLKGCVRNEDTVARLGGDEFVVLLESISDTNAPAQVAAKILQEIRRPFQLNGTDFYTTTSIGISLYPDDGTSPSELMRNADTAMYQVKQQGRNNFTFYSEHFTLAAQKKSRMESELHAAIAENQLQLWYQPQLNLDTEELIGLEALVRWQHPEKGLIAPDLFIPLAEESGLIVKISNWVINEACRQIRAWLDAGLNVPRMGINISGAEMREGTLINTLKNCLEEHTLDGSYLEIEITENFMLSDIELAVSLINELRELGINVAIDDFGTGYSSLSYLKKLPIQRLKIDKSFIGDIPGDAQDMAITKAIIAMGQSLGLEVIAEGVETREQQRFLRAHYCKLGQGYLFCRPTTCEEIERWLTLC